MVSRSPGKKIKIARMKNHESGEVFIFMVSPTILDSSWNIGSQTVSPSQYSFWSQLLACDSKIQTHNRMLTPEVIEVPNKYFLGSWKPLTNSRNSSGLPTKKIFPWLASYVRLAMDPGKRFVVFWPFPGSILELHRGIWFRESWLVEFLSSHGQ